MYTDDHLNLRSVRLVGAEKWEPQGPGLCFVFIRGGAGMFAISSASHQFAKGDVLVLRGGSGVNIRTSDNNELVFSTFRVLVEHLFPLFSVKEISQLQNLMGNLKSVKFLAAVSPSAADCHRLLETTPPQFNLDHRAHLLRVVVVILGEEFKLLQRSQPSFVSMEQHLMQVFEKLSANDLLTLSTDELSAKFGCSRRHLTRLFEQHFGFSVAALRMELRMLRAISLLRDAGVKVNHVAEQCGFNHLGLFYNCFKRRFGTSPGRWRTLSLETPASTSTTASRTAKHSDCPLHANGMCPMLGVSNPTKPLGPSAVHLKNSTLGAARNESTDLNAAIAGLLDSAIHSRLNTFT